MQQSIRIIQISSEVQIAYWISSRMTKIQAQAWSSQEQWLMKLANQWTKHTVSYRKRGGRRVSKTLMTSMISKRTNRMNYFSQFHQETRSQNQQGSIQMQTKSSRIACSQTSSVTIGRLKMIQSLPSLPPTLHRCPSRHNSAESQQSNHYQTCHQWYWSRFQRQCEQTMSKRVQEWSWRPE